MPARARDIFEQNNYLKWYYDPELSKDWKNFLKKYSYLFWINSMNMKDVSEWARFVGDRKPDIEHEPIYPGSEEEYARLQKLRMEAYLQMFRSFAEPTRELSREVQKGDYLDKVLSTFDQLFTDARVDEAAKLLRGISQVFAERGAEKFHGDLEAERFTIFEDDLLPYISCYESVYRSEKQIMGELTAEVKSLYRRAGYSVSRATGNLPPDEAKLELEFMPRLIDDEINAWKAGERGRALECLSLQRELLHEHLILWLPYMCDDIANQEFKEGIAKKFRGDVRDIQTYRSEVVEIDFYRSAAMLLKLCLEHDFANVEAFEQVVENFNEEKLREGLESYPGLSLEGENSLLLKA